MMLGEPLNWRHLANLVRIMAAVAYLFFGQTTIILRHLLH